MCHDALGVRIRLKSISPMNQRLSGTHLSHLGSMESLIYLGSFVTRMNKIESLNYLVEPTM
jgi:hypothetical protein